MLNRKKMKNLLFLVPLLSSTLFGKGTNCTNGHCFIQLAKQNTTITQWKPLMEHSLQSIEEDKLELVYDDGTIITVALNSSQTAVVQDIYINIPIIDNFLLESFTEEKERVEHSKIVVKTMFAPI